MKKIVCSRLFPIFILLNFLLFDSTPIKAQSATSFDLVLSGGRVIDPETNLDAIRNIGISKGRIMEITTTPLSGKETIDVSGLVVAPGFIDMHIHGVSNVEQEYQAHDGITTALELEWGLSYLKEFFESRTSKAMINYGASVSWAHARVDAITNYEKYQTELHQSIIKEGWNKDKILAAISGEWRPSFYQALTPKQTQAMLNNIKKSLNEGGLGVGMPMGYIPGSGREEVFRIFQLAGEMGIPLFPHVRNGGTMAIQQVIADATVTGAPLHVVHVNSMALSEIELAIEMINTAQDRGFDITTELYPYTAASTLLESAVFDDGWQERMGIDYGDLQWVNTGERLTEKTFQKYRKEGGFVILHMMKPEWIKAGIASPNTIIASDGMPYSPNAHPRTAGTYARVLGKYVREEKTIGLMEAIRKMTLLPAKRMEKIAPVMKSKGRMQVGCDADITIFDPKTVRDKATFEKGLAFSEGIQHVLVNGVPVIKNGDTVEGVFPGEPVYGKYKR